MNNKQYIAELARQTGFSQDDTQRLVRKVVNPISKKRQLVPPKLVLGFRPSDSVKEKLKNGGGENE